MSWQGGRNLLLKSVVKGDVVKGLCMWSRSWELVFSAIVAWIILFCSSRQVELRKKGQPASHKQHAGLIRPI